MKKTALFLVFCLMFMLSSLIAVIAHDNIMNDNINVIFTENSIFSDDEKLIIEKSFICDDDISTYGIKCILFGHDYKTEYIDAIRHKVSSTRPRCIMETYETKICVDCSDTVSDMIATTYIDCCQ